VHPSSLLQYTPFYDLFYGTTNLAVTVAIVLTLLLFVALGRRHKEAAIGLSVALALVTTTAIVLHLSDQKIDDTFAAHRYSSNYTPVTGLQFVGAPIVMAVAAAMLFVLAGRYTWVTGRALDVKLTIVTTFLLGASLFGTFAAQLAQDMYDVGNTYWSAWADFGNWLWAADFLLTCAVLAFSLITTTRHLRTGGHLRSKLVFTTKSSSDADPAKTGNTHIARTVEATA
jgi:hypothetical protein